MSTEQSPKSVWCMWDTGELDAGDTGELLGSQFGVCISPFEAPAAVAGNPHAAGARSIQSVRTFSFSAPYSEKPISVHTSLTTVRAGLDAGGTGELLGSQFGVCIPPFEAPAAVAGNPHAAGARSIQSVRTSRFQLHIREAKFSISVHTSVTTVRAGLDARGTG